MTIDLHDPDASLRAFVKARASLDGTDSVTHFGGNVHAWMPGGAQRHLFAFDGYNIARAVEADGGYDLLTREAAFYLDPQTRETLEEWTNPFTEERVKVVHIWNDPVNQRLRTGGPRPFRPGITELDVTVVFNADILLAYPSPLPRAEFPDNSQDDLYQAVELFQFFAERAALEDPEVASAPCLVSWTRLAPWLPFMRMADRPGQLIYHCRGMKLQGGYPDLPEHIRAYVEANDDSYTTAPSEFTEPNETSWTYFRKLAARAQS